MSAPYTPRSDSFAAQVCGFFSNNPDEELGLDEMVDNFMPGSRSNIHTQLSASVEAKLLTRRRDDDGEYIYRKGPELKVTAAVDPTPAPSPKPRRVLKARFKLDLSAIVIRDDVPLPSKSKSVPLIEQLGGELKKLHPGQSFVLPIEGQSVLKKAVQAAHRATQSRYSVRLDEQRQEVGVWCDSRSES